MANIFILCLILTFGFCDCVKRPNIVFIIADDLGWADVSWNDPNIISPNLEKLYNNSLKLQNYYVQQVCTPSRAAALTGVYPFHLGLQHSQIKPNQPSYLPLHFTTFPEKLKNLGYKTAAIGKWHLGFCDLKVTPTYRGFDQFYGFWLGSQDHFNHSRTFQGNYGMDFRDNLQVVYDQQGVYSVHSHSRRAVEIINKHNSTSPLYIYLAYQNVHTPLQVPQEYIKLYNGRFTGKRQTKAAMVTAMDEGIGNITKALTDRGLMDNTIVVFTTDNGGPVQEASLNFPYRGSKGTLFEGGTKAVGFIHGKMFRSGDFNGLFHVIDWFPTLLTAAGYNQLEFDNIDGHDQWLHLLENTTVREEFIYNIDEIKGRAGIRVGRYKLLIGKQGSRDGWYRDMSDVVNTKTSKLATIPQVSGFPRLDLNRTMLFDLENDPYEYDDISTTRPDIVRALYQRLLRYKSSMVPAFSPPLSAAANPAYFNDTWSPGWCNATAPRLPLVVLSD